MEPLPPPSVLGSDGAVGPHALQILSTEHWSLLSARSLGYTEAMNRAAMFIAALSGAVVALALVAQATDFGTGFHAFALVLLPVVWFLGLVTIVRLGQVNREDALWVQGMNRIRHAYLELAPELEPFFVTSSHDDPRGVLTSSLGVTGLPPFQGFISVPGVVAVLDAVVAGAITGIAALAAGAGTGLTIALGAVGFVACLVGFGLFAARAIASAQRTFVVRFPS
jgi:hypothetical protein